MSKTTKTLVPTKEQIKKWKEKAEKWDKLDKEIGEMYERMDNEDEGDGLISVGEAAAYAFGYL
jgi:hypothetical protein